MAKSKKDKSEGVEATVAGLDCGLTLFELTDLFHAAYKYHNDNQVIDVETIKGYDPTSERFKYSNTTVSRFGALRRVNAATLGSRPYLSGKGIVITKPNVSLGYLKWFLTYLSLPFKSFFTDGKIIKVQIDRRLNEEHKSTEQEKVNNQVERANNDNLYDNKSISSDTTNAFYSVLMTSKRFEKCREQSPNRMNTDGMVAWLNCDTKWDPEPIHALDLVTEPQCGWDSSTWSWFFIVRKLTAAEAISHVRKPGAFWRPKALRWALESAREGRGILDASHHAYHRGSPNDDVVCGENFMVQSFYSDKQTRTSNVGSYYGNMLVVEGYYTNQDGKVDKVIFFPSNDYIGRSKEQREEIEKLLRGEKTEGEYEDRYSGSGVLFYRKNVFNDISDAITVIPYDRSEPSLERQRPPSFELFPMLELASRLDCSIFNLALIMGVPVITDPNQGDGPSSTSEIELRMDGEVVDIGNKTFASTQLKADLTAMLSVRNMVLQHAAAKAFLGGLDGMETLSNGKGFELATLRLSRDSRVHKGTIEDFSRGVKEALIKSFKSIISKKDSLSIDTLLKTKFFSVLFDLQGHDPEIFDYKTEDIIEDTNLPYWINLDTIRTGASHFGASEQLVYAEIMRSYAQFLDQGAVQKLTASAIKGILGNEEAIDILGDPRDMVTTDQDQIYRARMENAGILGSVDQGSMFYEEVPVLQVKDDHVAHLSQVHLPLMKQIIDLINSAQIDFDSVNIDDIPEDDLNTRVNLILKVSAMSNHVQQHNDMLDSFGEQRKDIAELKEQTNAMLQAAEGLLHSLQIALRALQGKRQQREDALRGMAPESQIEREKIEVELQKLQGKMKIDQEKLTLANMLREDRNKQHLDKQVTKARDRNLKKQIAADNRAAKEADLNIKSAQVQQRSSIDSVESIE